MDFSGKKYAIEEMPSVRIKINLQLFSVQAPAQQGAKIKVYPAYSVFSQHS
jgi:hypothetical protein